MTSKQPALARVQCALICIKPDKKQILFEGRINYQIDKKLYSSYILKAVLTVYTLKVFGSRQSLSCCHLKLEQALYQSQADTSITELKPNGYRPNLSLSTDPFGQGLLLTLLDIRLTTVVQYQFNYLASETICH